MRIVALILVFFCFQELLAQHDSVYYFNAFFKRQKELSEVTYKGVIRTYNGKNYEVDFYTLDGVKEAFGEYSTRRLKKRNGVFVRYNGDERIILSANYSKGLLHGMFIRFYENGLMADSGALHHGSNTGVWKHWYPNGQVREVEKFSHNNSSRFGIRDREYMSWYPDGQLKDSGLYKSGNKTGIWLEYLDGGAIRSIGEYKRDWKLGLWRYFDTKGRLLYMRKFSRFNYDEEGTLVQINR